MTLFVIVASIEIDGQVACSDMRIGPSKQALDYDHTTMRP
jgi:hypothetical protein